MYLQIGETKLIIGKFQAQNTWKLELNFEYLFASHNNYRRFAQVVFDPESKVLKIKVKSEFKNIEDCLKLSQLMIGVNKLITEENFGLLAQILETSSQIQPQSFLQKQVKLVKYFL